MAALRPWTMKDGTSPSRRASFFLCRDSSLDFSLSSRLIVSTLPAMSSVSKYMRRDRCSAAQASGSIPTKTQWESRADRHSVSTKRISLPRQALAHPLR